MAIAKKNIRTRNRNMGLDESASASKEKGLLSLAVEVYKLNLAQNEAKRAYDKKRAELRGAMKTSKTSEKVFSGVRVSPDSSPITLEAKVETPINEKANIRKLVKLVDGDTFLNIVAATKTAIVELAGLAVFEQCKEESPGTQNVSVKLLKE